MDFSKLTAFLDSIEELYRIPSCDCSVYYKHKEVYRHSAGHRDYAKTQPVSDDDLCWMYSCSKVACMVAVMQLVEQGKLRLDDPVGKYLPGIDRVQVREGDALVPLKVTPVIEDLMTMSAGFNYNGVLYAPNDPNVWPDFKKLAREKPSATTRELINELFKEPLDFQPRSHFQYSMCHDVLAVVIEEITGERFADYMKDNIAKPLGMKDFEYHLRPEDRDRLSAQYAFDPATKEFSAIGSVEIGKVSDNYDSAGGGVVTRVSDYVLLADALANDGVGANGTRILTRASIDNMRTNRMDGARVADFWKMGRYGYGYGLGVKTLVNQTAALAPLGTFGWDGLSGAYLSADVKNNLAIFYTQHVIVFMDVYTVIHPKVRDFVYQALADEVETN
ncbi:MAG: beta-lactamase family protein [Treponema sp.]|jgi:CubicO group peptidase (beta-lactamase class C family)|nr:beta-lactamase family protein [Treponema sp.]